MLAREVKSRSSPETPIATKFTAIRVSQLPFKSEPITEPFKPFTQPTLQSASRPYLKRLRSFEGKDVDANEFPPRKKRRLRLELITSKLSEPYATPPTFIPLRKPLRAGVWARHRIAGRDMIRKAAIFNTIAMKRKTFGIGSANLQNQIHKASCVEFWAPKPRSQSRSRSPHKRKPPEAAKSAECTEEYDTFDAFELDDEPGEDWEEPDDVIYSDFNLIRSDESELDIDSYSEDYSFDSFDTGQTLTGDEGVKAIKVLWEIEKNVEFSYTPMCA